MNDSTRFVLELLIEQELSIQGMYDEMKDSDDEDYFDYFREKLNPSPTSMILKLTNLPQEYYDTIWLSIGSIYDNEDTADDLINYIEEEMKKNNPNKNESKPLFDMTPFLRNFTNISSTD